jgi:elongation factor G
MKLKTGTFAHVDAGKTTVTERMLALAGVVRSAGNVDDGNTVTDYLPAERERGITIQSAAISFDWGWHNNSPTPSHHSSDDDNDYEQNDHVRVQLIDTPGHVDFSVEVNRSVAVLDGAILVVDAVAGVQAQTETVWRAITRPSWNNHALVDDEAPPIRQDHAHEPLPCLALINKMDKDGSHFGKAMQSLREKLPGANPIAIQLPIFRRGVSNKSSSKDTAATIGMNDPLPTNLAAVPPEEVVSLDGEFVGVVDLIHMRAIIWPDNIAGVADVENCVPSVVNLLRPESHEPLHAGCQVTQEATKARVILIEDLANVDPIIEEYYLNEEEISNAELRLALRRATLAHVAVPVLAGAALKGKGVEPLLDAVADLLPSPLDRIPPALNILDEGGSSPMLPAAQPNKQITLGHPLNQSLLALAFKVVHMKGRGGSGDGRVVFARVYSGKLRDRESIQVVSPPAPGEAPKKPREERIGGMLELAGGRFDNVEGGICRSGDVCALVGLKTVVTGDTITLAGDSGTAGGKGKKSRRNQDVVCLAGVSSPKPVITVRLEAETSGEQQRLSDALQLMSIEDPSLIVEETDASTLLSGLGELHIEVTLDRLFREHGLEVMVGPPSVAYRETVKETIETPGGLLEYDRTIGGTRLQGAVHLIISQASHGKKKSSCVLLSDPVVTVGPKARDFLGLNMDLSEEELLKKNDLARALIRGCQGALKRGPHKSVAMANLVCHVEDVDAEGGLSALKALPGALQAASANAVAEALRVSKDSCTVLEPTMSLEITLPNDMVGGVLSDLNSRRGTVRDVIVGEDVQAKSLMRGDVPLVEILGYASSLRSLTGGEGAFSAEYKGHSPC